MSLNDPTLNALRDIGLFGGLSAPTLEALIGSLTQVDLQPGDAAFEEGEPGGEMFVVLAGELEVTKQARSGRPARVALLGPGDWFGEMSLLDIMPRSATVRAVAPARLARLTNAHLDQLYRSDLKSYALLIMNIAREISRKLRVADGILAETVASTMDRYRMVSRATH